MPWYRAGTVTVTNGSPVVTGAGTDFVSNASVGEVFLGADGRSYEITSVVSATELRILPIYQGATAGGQAYGIQPTESFARDLAIAVAALIASFAAVRDGIGQGFFPDGSPAAPAGRFAADQDTGFYRVGQNAMALVAGGVARLTVDGDGATANGSRFGIGGTSSSNLVHATNVSNWSSGVPDSANRWRVSENQFGSEMLTVLPNGNIGIGTIAPASRMHAASSNGTQITIESTSGSGDTGFSIKTPTRVWNMGQNIGGAGAGTFNLYDVTAGRPVWTADGAGSFRPGLDNGQTLGTAGFRWSTVYAGSGAIATSDARAKQQVGAVPDEWLDAWADVEWVRYRFNDAVERKGDDARWHVGLIAQQVHDAFAARGLDAMTIGLLCHDEWEATPEVPAVEEERDEGGEIVTAAQAAVPARPAGDRYGLRYDECQAIEAAYQRRQIDRLTKTAAQDACLIDALSARLAALEARG